MSFDTEFDAAFDAQATDPVRADAIRLLERALARVRAGYHWDQFYRRTWFRRRPQFCMHGALYRSDNGQREGSSDAHLRAENFVRDAIGGRDLIGFGTNPLPFTKRRVVRAYRRALVAARERGPSDLHPSKTEG